MHLELKTFSPDPASNNSKAVKSALAPSQNGRKRGAALGCGWRAVGRFRGLQRLLTKATADGQQRESWHNTCLYFG